MYQPLICLAVLRHQARRLRPAFYAQDLQRLPDPLIHRVRRDPQFDRDLLRGKVGIDKTKAVKLTGRQLRHPARY
jgi:hypothetical protein